MRYPTPRLPIPGQRLTVGWGRELMQSLRSAMPVAAPGMLIRRGQYGTSYTPTVRRLFRQYATTLLPFDVRWMSHDTDGTDPDNGEWQIYAPFGAMVVNYDGVGRTYTAMPKNDEGTDADGNATFQWYKIAEPEDSHALVEEIDGTIYKTWTVYVLTKPWARFMADTDTKANGEVAWTDAVATIGVSEYTDKDGEKHINHISTRLGSGAIEKTWDATAPFSIEYKLDDETKRDSGYTVEVVHQTKMLGRLQVNNVRPVNVKSSKEVWIRIEHKDEEFKLEALDRPPSNTKSNNDQTVYRIYDMDGGGVVKYDYRASIPTLPFYTSASSGKK